jgi:photosystem II stability/assembly factor-like uncharacterized protein
MSDMRYPYTYIILALVFAVEASAFVQNGWAILPRQISHNDLNAVYFEDSKRGWIVGDNGLISRTEDGGDSWITQKTLTKDAINDVYFRDNDNGYFLAGGTIFNSIDGGRTWRELQSLPPSDFDGATPELYSIRFRDKNKGWVVGSLSRTNKGGDSVIVDSLILRTEDAGYTWQRQHNPTREELIHLDFVSDKRGWIVGSGGTILFTQDGGESWQPQNSKVQTTLYHVDFKNDKRGWAVGEKGTIVRTTDGGKTWTTITSPVRNTLLNVQFVDDENGWAVGRGGAILRSGDSGLTWLQQDARTKQNLYGLFIDKKFGWVVGAGGTVLKYER